MKRSVSKYGTDSRFPDWSGAVLDHRFFNGATALALVLNWGALIVVHGDLIASNWAPAAAGRYGVAVVVCGATAKLIWHGYRFVRNFARAFACGVPLGLMLSLAVRGWTTGCWGG